MDKSRIERLKLASRFGYHAGGGWPGVLLQFIGLFAFYGFLAGIVIEPFLRWIGHPLKDSQPIWFTIFCALLFLVIVLFDVLIFSRRKKWLGFRARRKSRIDVKQ